jgi:CheY-like chemotaxis protein
VSAATAKPGQTGRQILFVDDDPSFLEAAKETFQILSDDVWVIHTANTPENALNVLKRQRMDLAIVDMNMPLLDGIQFLNMLGRRYPDLKKVTLTGFATEEKRSQCLANGAELFIEKPHTPEGFKSVFAMLDDLISWKPQQGFQGVLRRVGLQDVIQMECLGRNSSILEVHNDKVFGRIYIEDGNIIHATDGTLTGEPALQKLLALSGGSFELVPFEQPPTHTLEGQWEFLLMEAARVRDENAANAEPEVPEVPAAPDASSVRVLETLICSGAGEMLYQADCADANARAELLKRIAQQGAQLAQMLPLGNFDRLEMQFSDGRAIAQARTDRLVFVRTTTPPASA